MKLLSFSKLILVSLTALGTATYAASAQTLTWGPSGLDAGGHQSVVAVDPNNKINVISGADVSGIQLSNNGGQNFTLANQGLESTGYLHIAGVSFLTSSSVYMAAGNAKYGSTEGKNPSCNPSNPTAVTGIFHSTDGGVTWSPFNLGVCFAGGNQSSSHLPSVSAQLRSTGKLIDFHGNYLYAGSYDNGIYRCDMTTDACTQLTSTAGRYIRSIMVDPSNPTSNLYYASIDLSNSANTGVFEITNIQGTASAPVRVVNDCVEEISSTIGDTSTFYAVGAGSASNTCSGNGVIYRVSGGTATQLENVVGDEFVSVAALVTQTSPKQTTVLAGTLNGAAVGTGLAYFVDAGGSGSPTLSWGTPYNTQPRGGGVWWKSESTASQIAQANLMGNSGFTATNLQIAPDNETVYMSGRGQAMKSTDLGVSWYPIVHNMNVTFNRGIAADSNGVYVMDTDWQFLYSTDQMSTVTQNAPMQGPSEGSGYSEAIMPYSGGTFLAAGVQIGASNLAEVYTTTSPTVQASWTDEDLSTVHGLPAKSLVMGLASKVVSSKITLLAAVSGGGLYRGVKSSATSPATWTLEQSALAGASTNTAPIMWDSSNTYAYFYDRDFGIYRSADDGQTWSVAYSGSSAQTKPLSNGPETGYLALDEADDTLYISNSSGLYEVTHASTASLPYTPVQLSGTSGIQPGPIVYANSKLYVVSLATNQGTLPTANVYTYSGGTLTSIADTFAKANAGFPECMAVDSSGNVYLGMAGQGVIVGKP